MKIETVINNLFLKIAKKMGYELHKKKNGHSHYGDPGLNPTAIGAGVVADIAVDDSEIAVKGNNARAEAIKALVSYFEDEIETAVAEVALGTGDCIVRPFTDGKNIGMNIIGNDHFMITQSIGNTLKGIIMLIDEYETESHIFRLVESQSIKEENEASVVYIRHFAYKDESEISLLNTEWKELPEEQIILSDQLLLGRYKCPTIHRGDYNSENGVPITFGCEEIIENIKKKYAEYNEEFDRKRAKVFADRTLFRKDEKQKKDPNSSTNLILNGQEFVLSRTGMNNEPLSNMIYDYSPSIREKEFQNANHFNLSVLEMCCGFSRGIFTAPETAFATATEMKNSLKKTFSFVKRFRRKIEIGNEMLFHAIDIIINLNHSVPAGDWKLEHNWSYDYIEETRERFNQLIQMESMGAVDKAEVRAWGMNEDIETARTEVERINAETQSDDVTDEESFE